MKEKTFEELIEEVHHQERYGSFITNNAVIKLMQQVRESTIAECHLIADKYYFNNSEKIIIDINNLPTNSIKTDL